MLKCCCAIIWNSVGALCVCVCVCVCVLMQWGLGFRAQGITTKSHTACGDRHHCHHHLVGPCIFEAERMRGAGGGFASERARESERESERERERERERSGWAHGFQHQVTGLCFSARVLGLYCVCVCIPGGWAHDDNDQLQRRCPGDELIQS